MVTNYPSDPFTLSVLCNAQICPLHQTRKYSKFSLWLRQSKNMMKQLLVTCHTTVSGSWGCNYFVDGRVKSGNILYVRNEIVYTLLIFLLAVYICALWTHFAPFLVTKSSTEFFFNTAILPTLILVFKFNLPSPLIFFCCGHQCFL